MHVHVYVHVYAYVYVYVWSYGSLQFWRLPQLKKDGLGFAGFGVFLSSPLIEAVARVAAIIKMLLGSLLAYGAIPYRRMSDMKRPSPTLARGLARGPRLGWPSVATSTAPSYPDTRSAIK